eukprot:COSAG05_NODE_405_length_10177_cov_2.310776_2_plen_218_part_00
MNDGICDCCDGSDEWAVTVVELRPGVKRTVFVAECNRASCAALAVAHNKEQAAQAQQIQRALQVTAQLVDKGAALREEERSTVATQRERHASMQTPYERLQNEHSAWIAAESIRAAAQTEAAAAAGADGEGGQITGEGGAEVDWAHTALACDRSGTLDGCAAATQSSVNWLGEAWKAVDGEYSSEYDAELSCTHTDDPVGTDGAWFATCPTLSLLLL